ncbi:MAG TPA: RecQ family ATP-dependent DNA helicase [Candidatus Limiplasma sp.]|nr:RecQ family ATP-dependent DNA helicase [Candidatus Limiplasma sp.]
MTKQECLKLVFGYDAFREGQEALIDQLLAGGDALGIMPTGAGKSVCYQVPALLREGVALIVSPLISLMKDQVAALKAAGVPAAYINSSLTPAQQREALRRAGLGWYRMVYVAPERLDVPEFQAFAQNASISLIAVDEAHCVSQWGQDFRPSYLKIADFIKHLPVRPPVGAFTATATPQVKEDMVRMLRLEKPLTVVTGFDRPNLRFANMKPTDKFAALMEIVRKHAGESGIVYCATRKTVEEVCERLKAEGVSATRYHAGLDDAERMRNQDDFQFDRCSVIVATNAFGMGIDKSDVSFVAHYNMPRCLENYYQEAGRAGRDGSPADCVLLYGGQDVMTARWMLEHSEPNPELSPDEQEALYLRDVERLKRMTFYSTSKTCLRQAILRYFGENAGDCCDHCSVCEGAPFEVDTAREKPQARTLFKRSHPEDEALDAELYQALKEERQRLAAEKRVPAYVIFTDATLRDMTFRRPHTWDDLLRVAGIGERKRDQYGDTFLELICRRDGMAYEPPRRTEAESDRRPAKEKWNNAGKPWTDAEDARLKAAFENNATISELCEEYERSAYAIRMRLKRLGLTE